MSIQLGRLAIEKEAVQEILDFLPYPFIVSKTLDGSVHNVFTNQKFIDEIGYSVDEIPTADVWYNIAYPDSEYRRSVKERWTNLMSAARESGNDSISIQVRIQTRFQKERWYEVKASTGDPRMVAFIDIHAARSREENLKMLNHNRDRVLSILGHDLRGPINQLYSLSQMAMREQVDKNQFLKLLANVNDKAFQSLEFLSTTLTWAKSNFDSIQVKKEEIEVKVLAEEVVFLYEAGYSAKNIRVTFAIDPNHRVHADREIVITVLRNLVSNAIKFTNKGGSIAVGVHETDRAHLITVTDNGIGMDAQTASRILSSNYSSADGTHGEKGLGIGIMLCNDLLKRMGGELHVKSDLGKGTCMKMVLCK